MEPRSTGDSPRPASHDPLEEEKLIRRKRAKREVEMEAGELNIIPYLDIVTNLVMFLLQASATAVALGEISTKLPPTGAGASSDEPPPPEEKPPLRLTIVLGEKGITVAGAEAVLGGAGGAPAAEGPTLPRVNNNYDYLGLTKLLVSVKKAYPKETTAFLVPEDTVQYSAIVATMDAMRENGPDLLFPDVMFAGF